MLKFNVKNYKVLNLESHLNTSHVKVQLWLLQKMEFTIRNLNTSHVKVQLHTQVYHMFLQFI